MTFRRLALVVALTVAGCNSDHSDDAPAGHTVSDSSGVTVVTNHSAQWTEHVRWEISETPILEIGNVDGDEAYLFKRINGVLRLPGGTIVAADETEVRLFDAEGVHILSHGRQGEGPGEYQLIRAIMACQPDHFNVYDLSWRQSTYTLDGDFVDTQNVLPDGMRPYTVRCTPSGTFVSLLWSPQVMDLPIGLFDTESSMVVGDARAGVDTMMTVPGGQRLGHERGSGPHPFGTTTSFAAFEENIVISTGEAYEYRMYDLQGGLLRVVRMPGQARTIHQDDINAQAKKEAERYPPELFDSYYEENRKIEMPDRFPAYSQLLLDADNNVWLRHHSRPMDTVQRWDVCDADGVFLGSVELNSDIEIVQIGTDFVLGHHTNEAGAPQVVMWGLARGE